MLGARRVKTAGLRARAQPSGARRRGLAGSEGASPAPLRPSVARSAHEPQRRSRAPAAVWSPRTPARSARRPQGEDGGSEGASPEERSDDQPAQRGGNAPYSRAWHYAACSPTAPRPHHSSRTCTSTPGTRRACSRDLTLPNLAWWARRKGITLLGTGDFTHPAWYEHLRENLRPAEPGLYRLSPDAEGEINQRLPPRLSSTDERAQTRFALSVEISTIYKRDDRTRKVHHLDLPARPRRGRPGSTPPLGPDRQPRLRRPPDPRPRLPRPAGDHAGGQPGRIPRTGAHLDAVVLRARLQVRLRRDRRLLRRPGRAHLRRRDRPVLRPGDELAGLQPRPLPAGVQLGRALAAGAGPRGDRSSPPTWTTSPSGTPCAPATAWPARSSSSPRRASTTPTGTGRAASTGSRRGPGPTAACCPECGKPLTVGVLSRVEELADRPSRHRPKQREAASPHLRRSCTRSSARSPASARGPRPSRAGSTPWSPRSGRSWTSSPASRSTTSAAPAASTSARRSAACAAARCSAPRATTASTGSSRSSTPDELAQQRTAGRHPVRRPAASEAEPRPTAREAPARRKPGQAGEPPRSRRHRRRPRTSRSSRCSPAWRRSAPGCSTASTPCSGWPPRRRAGRC